MARDIISLSRAGSLEHTHGGPGAVYIAPYGTTFPTGIGDIVDLDPGATQWEAKTPWEPLGLTRGGINVSRGFEEVKRDADQTYGAYGTRPIGWQNTISTEVLKIDAAMLQRIWVGGAITETAGVQTTLQIAIAAAGVTLTLNSGSGITTGNYLVLGTGAYQELVKVSNIAGNVVTLAAPGAVYAHASGDLALKFTEKSMPFGTARALDRKLVAVIAPTNYEMPTLGGTFNGYTAWVLRSAALEAGQRQLSLTLGADWSLPVSFYGYPDPEVADPDTDTMAVFTMGPNV